VKIAVIGSGISGLGAAFVLQREHDVTLFEKSGHVGGHTLTLDVEQNGASYAVDTGFVVFNETTYPNFVRLLEILGVATLPTSMSFGVRCDTTGVEYCGTSLNTLFAQRGNLLNPDFYRLILGIMQFNRVASRFAREGGVDGTLEEFLERFASSGPLRERYLVPLVAAIWSMDPGRFSEFPAGFFLRFSSRHRLLQTRNQLRWRVIAGGSREYVRALVARLRNGVRTDARTASIRRRDDGVDLELAGGESLRFDHVVIATHSDQALRLLADATDDEREILGAINYQSNQAVLHTDTAMLPHARRARANWNYLLPKEPDSRALTTYDMSGLQGLSTETPFLVTLNDDDERVDRSRTIHRLRYSHPVFTTRAVEAQKKRNRISGRQRTHFCGAYWGFGFHEDGLKSALDVCLDFGLRL
jgi:predicted NAD/FAD-binding protein